MPYEYTPAGDGLTELAYASCDDFVELQAKGGAEPESQALSAAVVLFACVFRLQTSDVRQQLLGHLCTAASKAAEKATKDARGTFGLGGGSSDKSPYSSPLANVSAALLGSLTKLRDKPSKSPLVGSLAAAIDEALAPCLADSDPAVRRAAAQAVGMVAQLLGSTYASRFLSAATAKLSEAKGRDESKAGYSLALGWLGMSVASSQVEGPPFALKEVVVALSAVTADASSSPMVCEWATHALGSIARAAATGQVPSADFRPVSSSYLAMASSLCLADPRPNAHTARSICRLGTCLISALAADDGVKAAAASGGKGEKQLATLIRRCAVLSSAACNLAPTQGLQAEALHYTCATLGLPPSLLPPSTQAAQAVDLPPAILAGLKSPNLELRRAAISAQRVLSEVAAAQTQASQVKRSQELNLFLPTRLDSTRLDSTRLDSTRLSGLLVEGG